TSSEKGDQSKDLERLKAQTRNIQKIRNSLGRVSRFSQSFIDSAYAPKERKDSLLRVLRSTKQYESNQDINIVYKFIDLLSDPYQGTFIPKKDRIEIIELVQQINHKGPNNMFLFDGNVIEDFVLDAFQAFQVSRWFINPLNQLQMVVLVDMEEEDFYSQLLKELKSPNGGISESYLKESFQYRKD
ncbi:hypothetical protein DFA_05756, partial [Cavenderia fasciculata]